MNEQRRASDTAQVPINLASQSILEEAHAICNGVRNKHYGEPIDNHSLTSDLYTAYLDGRLVAGRPMVDAEAVCVLNILQKISRSVYLGGFTRDGLVDIAGYAYNIEKVYAARDARADAEEARLRATIAADGIVSAAISSALAPTGPKKRASNPSARIRR